ncbi:hypothetical protein [Pseudomonas citronellolis]|jgi:hypothetical protein|uniref:hypothetical protein n=1 Tax=Pseudomonas citronellolis TaxID=53408 RepID=UPI002FD967BD
MIAINDPVVIARLNIQRALLGEVSGRVRAVAFSISEASLDVRLYFDGPINLDDIEHASYIEAEVMADYDVSYRVSVHCIRLDVPSPISDDGVWVFMRCEE